VAQANNAISADCPSKIFLVAGVVCQVGLGLGLTLLVKWVLLEAVFCEVRDLMLEGFTCSP
jgi:hypothetical protein